MYYVNYLANVDGSKFKDGYGEAFPIALLAVTKAQYADSVIIAADTEASNPTGNYIYQTLAHEIGHILINNGKHYPSLVNLMYDPPQSKSEITDTRRIIARDANAMLKNRKNLLLPPP